jgi:hypothetical protein
MSARPEHFVPAPEHPREPKELEPPPADAKESDESDDSFLQWVALAVLLACWLAEAYTR